MHGRRIPTREEVVLAIGASVAFGRCSFEVIATLFTALLDRRR